MDRRIEELLRQLAEQLETESPTRGLAAGLVDELRALRAGEQSRRTGARAWAHRRHAYCASCGARGVYSVYARRRQRLRHQRCYRCGAQNLRWIRYRQRKGKNA